MSKQSQIKTAIKAAGLNISCRTYEDAIKQYNNHEMPLGKRVQEISQDPTEFIKYLHQRISNN